jgi:hypothetical protein
MNEHGSPAGPQNACRFGACFDRRLCFFIFVTAGERLSPVLVSRCRNSDYCVVAAGCTTCVRRNSAARLRHRTAVTIPNRHKKSGIKSRSGESGDRDRPTANPGDDSEHLLRDAYGDKRMSTRSRDPRRDIAASAPVNPSAPVNQSYPLRGRRCTAGSMPNWFREAGPNGGAEPAAELPGAGERGQPRRCGRHRRAPERWLLPGRRRGRGRLQASQRDPEAPFVQPHDSPLCDRLRVEARRGGRIGSVKHFRRSRKNLTPGGLSVAWGWHMAEKFSGPGTNWRGNRRINRRPGRSEPQVPRSRDRVSAHRADG